MTESTNAMNSIYLAGEADVAPPPLSLAGVLSVAILMRIFAVHVPSVLYREWV